MPGLHGEAPTPEPPSHNPQKKIWTDGLRLAFAPVADGDSRLIDWGIGWERRRIGKTPSPKSDHWGACATDSGLTVKHGMPLRP